jgi:hypothetical protein
MCPWAFQLNLSCSVGLGAGSYTSFLAAVSRAKFPQARAKFTGLTTKLDNFLFTAIARWALYQLR